MHLYNLCSCTIYGTVPGGMPQNTKLKPPLKQHRDRSPSPALRRKDATTEKKDSEPAHNSKGHNENNQKKDGKVESTQKTRVIHHKMHDKQHTVDDRSKCHDMTQNLSLVDMVNNITWTRVMSTSWQSQSLQ